MTGQPSVVEVLVEHAAKPPVRDQRFTFLPECRCGWLGTSSLAWAVDHGRHVGEALAAAGLLASGPTLAEAHHRCDCVPTLGPAHCHGCGVEAGVEVPWDAAPCAPAAHERRVRVATLREAADATSRPRNGAPYEVWAWCSQWLRARAARIEAEGGA